MAWKYNDRIIRVGRSWTGIALDENGNEIEVTHPRNWAIWSDEDKVAAGLVWEDDPAPFDSRFYWSAGIPKNLDDVNEVDEDGNPLLNIDGVQVVTKGLKTNAIAHVKTTAAGKLQSTDWYVTRQAETGTAIPSAVTDYRAAVRTASETIETAIQGVTTHADFMALYEAPEGGNAPINDWPENN
jgi:hypothetical protein